jgi:hypothetical protein
MARIRSIKPEFPQSESMGNVSRDARWLVMMMWTIADDSGRLRGNSRMLASLLFPYDDDAPGLIGGWLDELDREGCIGRYTHDGSTYIEVTNWLSHQKIDKPTPSKIPPFDQASRILANPRESSSEERRGEEGRGEEGIKEGNAPDSSGSANKSPAWSTKSVIAEGVDATHLKDWIKARKSALTETAWAGLKAEASKAGIEPAEAVRICAVKGWRGFDSTWNWRSAALDAKPETDARDNEILRLMRKQQGEVIDA